MAKAIETLSIQLKFTDVGSQAVIEKLRGKLKQLEMAASGAKPQIMGLRREILAQGEASRKTISNITAQRDSLASLRNEAKIGGHAFKKLTEDIKRLDTQLDKSGASRRGGRGGRALRATQMAGAVISGGIFGGPEGAMGGAIGGAIGGVPGAFAGSAIGAQLGGLRQAAGAAAEYAANLSRLRIALKGVTTSQGQYSKALEFIQQTTKDFAVPQEIVTKQFTKLQASVLGAGGNLDDTKKAFNGIVAAVRATGGSLADVDSALTATAQVFSKGKVSAEELRQQIGERLPGAFTLFADSIGLTPQELDKALEQGQVTLQDFQTFAESIFNRYGETAKIIASGPEGAGDRLTVALGRLNESVGLLLKPIGAFFQNTFAAIVRDITRATNALARFLNLSFDQGKLAAAQAKFNAAQAIIDSPTAAPREKQRALSSRESARKVIATQTRLQNAGLDVVQPPSGGGLPGAGSLSLGGTGGGVKDLTQAQYNALAAKRATAQAPLFEREEAIRAEADAARAAAAALPPLKQKNELEEISKRENQQIAALHKEMNGVFKELGAGLAEQLKLDSELKASLQDRKYELGLITEEEYKQIEVERERAQLAAKGASPEQIEEQLSVFKKLLDETPIDKFIRDASKELKDLQTMAVSVAQSIGNAIGNTLTSGVAGLIAGTKNAKEVLADFLKEFAGILAQQASKIIATYVAIGIAKIFAGFGSASTSAPKTMPDGVSQGGTFGGFNFGGVDQGLNFDVGANGGPVSGGSPMLVGERGPELFVPFTNGSITSSESLGADMANAMSVPFLPGGNRGGTTSQMLNRQENIQVNRQESLRQMSVPFTRTSEASMVASAEQQTAEAISNPAPLDVRFESQSINGVEYVTSEQHQSGMAQAAERGRALTLAALQNSVKARRRVGL